MTGQMTAPMTTLDWIDKVADIPEAGLLMRRTATLENLEALRLALEVLSCESVEVTYRLRSRGAGCYYLKGNLHARVTQACIVSLDPVPERIATDLDVEFKPAATGRNVEAAETDIDDPLAGTDIELIENGRIDIGRVVFEEILSLLDPYPRVQGAELDKHESSGFSASERADNPFAKLSALKDHKPSS